LFVPIQAKIYQIMHVQRFASLRESKY